MTKPKKSKLPRASLPPTPSLPPTILDGDDADVELIAASVRPRPVRTVVIPPIPASHAVRTTAPTRILEKDPSTIRVELVNPRSDPMTLQIISKERSVDARVQFKGERKDVEARVTTRLELSPDECATVIAWCRQRHPAPAIVRSIALVLA